MSDRSRTGYALTVLFCINALNFFDRVIGGALGEPIRRELQLSDSALGALGTAFTLLYAFVGIPLGRLADRAPRKIILAAAVFVWSLLTSVSGMARTFAQLFVSRLGVGAGEAACAPAATSLIGDLVPPQRRARAMSLFMLGLPIGIALSYLAASYIAAAYGWRTAFLLAGVPGILAAIAALFIDEPVRGAKGVGQAGVPVLHPWRKLLSIPTLWWLILSGALHNFNMYALGSFLAPLLMRYHGATLQDVVEPSLRGTAMALYFFAMYVLGASFGPLGTGMASDYFTRKAAGAAASLEPFRGEGLHAAMYLVPVLSALLAMVLFAACRGVRRQLPAAAL